MRSILLAFALAVAPTVVLAAPNPDGLDSPQSKLSDVRMAAARKAYDATLASWKQGGARLDDVYQWSHRIVVSELEREPIARRDSDTTYRDHQTRMRDLEAAVTARHKAGLASTADVAAAAFYRAEAEFWFENFRIM